jgi:PAS domain-containing protein
MNPRRGDVRQSAATAARLAVCVIRRRYLGIRPSRILDDAPDVVFVGELFRDGARCADANAVICEMLGYSQQELVGMKFDDLAPTR